MESSTQSRYGGCLCGEFRYEISAQPDFVGHCFCRDCQRATGSAGTTVLSVPQSAFTLTQGETRSFKVTAASGMQVARLFCPTCGSPLFTEAEMAPGQIFVKCASLDDPASVTPTVSCWTASAPQWAALPENVLCFDGNPEG